MKVFLMIALVIAATNPVRAEEFSAALEGIRQAANQAALEVPPVTVTDVYNSRFSAGGKRFSLKLTATAASGATTRASRKSYLEDTDYGGRIRQCDLSVDFDKLGAVEAALTDESTGKTEILSQPLDVVVSLSLWTQPSASCPWRTPQGELSKLAHGYNVGFRTPEFEFKDSGLRLEFLPYAGGERLKGSLRADEGRYTLSGFSVDGLRRDAGADALRWFLRRDDGSVALAP